MWFETTATTSAGRVPDRQRNSRSFRQCPSREPMISTRGRADAGTIVQVIAKAAATSLNCAPRSSGTDRRVEQHQVDPHEVAAGLRVAVLLAVEDVARALGEEAGHRVHDAWPVRAVQREEVLLGPGRVRSWRPSSGTASSTSPPTIGSRERRVRTPERCGSRWSRATGSVQRSWTRRSRLLRHCAQPERPAARDRHVRLGRPALPPHWLPRADDAVEIARTYDAILLGAIGAEAPTRLSDRPPISEHELLWGTVLALRQGLDLAVNVRPLRAFPDRRDPGPGRGRGGLRGVRENTEGEYAGIGGRFDGDGPEASAIEVAVHTRRRIERCARYAFDLAGRRGGSSST